MPSRRTRKQRGGGVDVVRAQEESIRQKEDELKFHELSIFDIPSVTILKNSLKKPLTFS